MTGLRWITLIACALAAAWCTTLTAAEPTVQDAADAADADTLWIEGDMDAAYEKAKETGKPLLVAFR